MGNPIKLLDVRSYFDQDTYTDGYGTVREVEPHGAAKVIRSLFPRDSDYDAVGIKAPMTGVAIPVGPGFDSVEKLNWLGSIIKSAKEFAKSPSKKNIAAVEKLAKGMDKIGEEVVAKTIRQIRSGMEKEQKILEAQKIAEAARKAPLTQAQKAESARLYRAFVNDPEASTKTAFFDPRGFFHIQ